MPLANPAHQALLDAVDDSLANICRHSVRLVATLAEIEVQEVHLELGYSSMWDFCINRYKMTKDETQLRLTVARLLQKFPQLLGPLEQGEITLTNLSLLRNMLDASNVEALVALSSHKRKVEVQELVAAQNPEAANENELKKVRQEPAEGSLPKPPNVEPAAPEEYDLKLRIDCAFHDEIQEACALTQHTNPTGDLLVLMRAGIRALIKERKKRKYGATDKPASNPRPSKDPGYVTAATRRAVVARDGLQCAFLGTEGHRCASRKKLEFDHVALRARGGSGDTENIRILCRTHNDYLARKALGERFVAEKIADAREARAAKATNQAEAAAVEDEAKPEVQESSPATIEPPEQAATAKPQAKASTKPKSRSRKAPAAGVASAAEVASDAKRRGPSITKMAPKAGHLVQTESKEATKRFAKRGGGD